MNKRVLESERVCSKHFVYGEPAPDWDQFHVDWVPTVAWKYVEKDHKNAADRALRAKKRRRQAIERAELEVTTVTSSSSSSEEEQVVGVEVEGGATLVFIVVRHI